MMVLTVTTRSVERAGSEIGCGPIFRPGALVFLAFLVALLSACTKDPASLFEDAKERSASGDKAGAIVNMKAAIQQEPANGEMRFFLGRLYNETFDSPSAEKELRRAAELGVVEGGRVAVELARALRLQAKNAELLKEIEPNNVYEKDVRASIVALRGRALQAVGKGVEARSSLSEAEQISPENPDVVLLAAQLKVVQGDAEGALALVEGLLGRVPGNLEALTYKAGVLRHLGRTDDALKAFDDVLKVHPTHYGALRGAVVLRTWSGRVDEAQKFMDVLRKTYKDHPQVIVDQGVVDFARQKYDQSKAAAEKVLKVYPEVLPAQLLLGLSQQALGDAMQAEQSLSKYVAADPGTRVGRYALAAQLLTMNNASRAAEVLAPTLGGDLKDPVIMSLAGDIHARLGDHNRALDWYTRAAESAPERADPHVAKGFVELRQGRIDSGLDSLENAVGLVKRATHSSEVLVMMSLARGDLERAGRVVALLEKQSPQSPITHNLRGLVLRAEGKSKESVQAFETALQHDAAFFPAAFNLAQMDLASGNTGAARKRYETVLGANKDDLPSLLAMASIERLAGRSEQEEAYLERAMKVSPNDMSSRRRMVTALWLRGEKARAIEMSENALAAAPDNPEAIALAAQTYLFAGNPNRALQVISRLESVSRNSPSVLVTVAQFQAAAGRTSDAESTLRTVLRTDPRFEGGQRGLVGVMLAGGRDREALEYARQIQKAQPQSAIGFVLEGEVNAYKSRHTEALGAFRMAQSRAPESGSIAVNVFRSQSAIGKRVEAETELEKFTKVHPRSIEARLELAYAKYMVSEYDAAAVHYESVLRDHPTNAYGLNGLAWVYHKKKDPRARRTAEWALAQYPDSPQIQDTLGYILVDVGETKRGHELIKAAAAAMPQDPDIRYHLAWSLSKIGDHTGAKAELDRLLSAQANFASRRSAEQLKATLRDK